MNHNFLMANRGRFIPKNPQKYLGDASKILFRSSWELNVMRFFDDSAAIYRWASEELAIPYISPIDGRVHHYYPDFIIIYIGADGEQRREIVEVKPMKEAVLTDRSSVHDRLAIAVNESKWAAAIAYSQQRGWNFRVLTEMSIFKQGKKPAPKKTTPKKPKSSVATKPGKRKL